jgi:hypothetical protein
MKEGDESKPGIVSVCMSREAFYRDIGRALRLVGRPTVIADSSRIDGDQVAAVIERADLWLTPKIVAEFAPDDFSDLPEEARERLLSAVREFRDAASRVDPAGPATQEQYVQGKEGLEGIVGVLRHTVLLEWRDAVSALITDAESWSKHRGWVTKREEKSLTEGILGQCELPQLSILADGQTLLLHPIARFAPGCLGVADLSVWPSFDSIMISRQDDGWQIHHDRGRSVTRVPWNEASFLAAIERLKRRA